MFYNKLGLRIFMSVYLLLLAYSSINTAATLNSALVSGSRGWAVCCFVILFALGLSLPAGMIAGAHRVELRRLGGVALMFVLHFSAAFVFLNIWSLAARFTHIMPPSRRAAAIVICIALLWITYGVAKAQRLTVRRLDVTLPGTTRDTIVIAAVSDIHAGATVNRGYLHRLQRLLADSGADMLLLLGDIVDGDMPCAREAGIGEMLSEINFPLGKYAVLGNHDIYAGVKELRELLQDADVRLLEDQAVVIDDAFTLVGRNDMRGPYFGLTRAPLCDIIRDPALPLIVADHTPCSIEEASACGAALQLSGHTHGGQVFPLNLLMKMMYGISSGHMKVGSTEVYVSSGAGLWTMPIRTVTNNEIVICTISFKSAD